MQRCDASAALGESLSRQRVSTCRTGRSSTHIYIFSDESLSIGDRLFGFRYNVQPSSTERSCARHELQANSRSPNRDATFVIYDAIKQVTEVIGNTIHNRKLQSRFRRVKLAYPIQNLISLSDVQIETFADASAQFSISDLCQKRQRENSIPRFQYLIAIP
jgi:hypothetical protein